jgi:hypothetical protein
MNSLFGWLNQAQEKGQQYTLAQLKRLKLKFILAVSQLIGAALSVLFGILLLFVSLLTLWVLGAFALSEWLESTILGFSIAGVPLLILGIYLVAARPPLFQKAWIAILNKHLHDS